jgi:hypothetical protein
MSASFSPRYQGTLQLMSNQQGRGKNLFFGKHVNKRLNFSASGDGKESLSLFHLKILLDFRVGNLQLNLLICQINRARLNKMSQAVVAFSDFSGKEGQINKTSSIMFALPLIFFLST